MPVLTFSAARQVVVDTVRATLPQLRTETCPLSEAAGRVLAEDIAADRDMPPDRRSARDGFAVRAEETPGEFIIIGESRAGEPLERRVEPGRAAAIMTGAAVPEGADAVVMIERVTVRAERVCVDFAVPAGDCIRPQGSEARAGTRVLKAGARIGPGAVALLAAVGRTSLRVYAKPRVAILATGDELVDAGSVPAPHQTRDSNTWALAALIAGAGGIPVVLPVARDTLDATTEALRAGFAEDLLLISGGVSAGRYDVVEPALRSLDAHIEFDRVLIQPGQPLVFGRALGRFFFGLPGNPASTMVTFAVFARAALGLLSGEREVPLPLTWARLAGPLHVRPGLTRFLPARLAGEAGEITPIPWQGSADLPALAAANAYLVTDPERADYAAGDWIQVLLI